MTERRRTSRAENQVPTKRPPPPSTVSTGASTPPVGRRRSSRPPQSGITEHHNPRQTLSVAIVALGDIPTLLGNIASDDAPPSIAPLLAAVDGDLTVAELADRLRIDPEQARAMIAELVDRGVVALSRKSASSSGVGTVRTQSRSLDYWLAGLKPRTK
jgi:hypothetical protein